VERSNSYQL